MQLIAHVDMHALLPEWTPKIEIDQSECGIARTHGNGVAARDQALDAARRRNDDLAPHVLAAPRPHPDRTIAFASVGAAGVERVAVRRPGDRTKVAAIDILDVGGEAP